MPFIGRTCRLEQCLHPRIVLLAIICLSCVGSGCSSHPAPSAGAPAQGPEEYAAPESVVSVKPEGTTETRLLHEAHSVRSVEALEPGNYEELSEVKATTSEPAPQSELPSPGGHPLHWNWWWEVGRFSDKVQPSFKPVALTLQPKTHYTLVLDLARIGYISGGKTGARPLSPDLGKQIGERTKDPDSADKMTMRALVIPSPRFFSLVGDRVQDLVIDITPLKANTPVPEATGTLAEQVKDGSLGLVRFNLKTGANQGLGSIAISIWYKDLPLDEIVLKACIGQASSCATPGMESEGDERGLVGIDPSRLAQPTPDAALHFIELDKDAPLVGVFRRKGWERGRYVTWQMNRSAADLRNYLRETLRAALNSAVSNDDHELDAGGLALQSVLFGGKEEDISAARKAFLEFVDSHFEDHPKEEEKQVSQSLFVRTVPFGQKPSFILPLGMLAVKREGRSEFLGFHFRIEAPLSSQSYVPPPGCLKRWIFVLPELSDATLAEAWNVIADIPFWEKLKEQGFDSTLTFRSWLEDDTAEDPNSLLVVLGHHDQNLIWFDKSRKRLVPSTLVQRRFLEPSVLVLNGCGTGAGESDFLERFNANGMAAAIVTSTDTSGPLAGAFLRALYDSINSADAQGKTLSHAYFEAIRNVSSLPVPGNDKMTYGARALTYVLLGNGTIPICKPEVE